MSDSWKNIVAGQTYLRFERAARLFGVTAMDLLSLAAAGKIRVLAPVKSAGTYTWPNDFSGFFGVWELSKPVRATFGPADRVFLFPQHLAELEGQGWVIPDSFVCPDRARELYECWKQDGPSAVDLDMESLSRLRELSFYERWQTTNSDQTDGESAGEARTTIQDLFVLEDDLEAIGEELRREGRAINCEFNPQATDGRAVDFNLESMSDNLNGAESEDVGQPNPAEHGKSYLFRGDSAHRPDLKPEEWGTLVKRHLELAKECSNATERVAMEFGYKKNTRSVRERMERARRLVKKYLQLELTSDDAAGQVAKEERLPVEVVAQLVTLLKGECRPPTPTAHHTFPGSPK